jgi:hypothetical protein
MPDTLGIDDEDAVDIVRELESSFDIVISDSEAAACRTLGDVFDLVSRRYSDSGVGGQSCASAMTFYRLRRAFVDFAPAIKLHPSTRLSDLPNISVRRLFKKIEAQTGLRLPRKVSSWVGRFGAIGALAGLLGMLIVGIFYGAWTLAPGVLVVTAFSMMSLDPGKFPAGCETLGELSTKVARLNFGHLAKAGARVTQKDLWSSLTEVVSQYSSTPVAEMTSDALLLQSQRSAA